ncbi:MAG TPA: hypothetical protein HA346_02840 [Thermoplasmata archaeon]|nr:hypothetical protein [Thermoplasmata archaeon]
MQKINEKGSKIERLRKETEKLRRENGELKRELKEFKKEFEEYKKRHPETVGVKRGKPYPSEPQRSQGDLRSWELEKVIKPTFVLSLSGQMRCVISPFFDALFVVEQN